MLQSVGPPMEKIFEGDLASFEVPDLLTFLNLSQPTGVLVLERRDQETKLFLREGRPVFATSTGEDLRLGTMLVRMGKLSAQSLDKVLQRTKSASLRIGQALLSEKLLTEDGLASFLKVQVSEVIFDTFVWREGTFTFYDRVPPPATVVTLEMDLRNLIMEGVRRIDVRGRLDAVFPERNMVVEAVVNPERIKQAVTLTQDEWRLFFLIDGRRSIREICHLAGNPDEATTLQILHNLLTARFVALGPAAPDAPASLPTVLPVEGGVTVKMPEVKAAAAPAVVPSVAVAPSVEFNAGLAMRKLTADDTHEIVSKKAVAYLANAKKVTISRLVLVQDGAETSFPLIRDAYTLGRHRNNDIVISDPKASSFHARIDRSSEGFVLVDLKSRNGSWVNGKRAETALLKTGDELRLGMAKLIYKVDYTSSV
jgi:Domain of unknown function (DUF4388)/FHA domain